MTGVAIPFSDESTYYSSIKGLPELVGGEHVHVELQQDAQPYLIQRLSNPLNWANMSLLGEQYPAVADALKKCKEKGFIVLHCPVGKINFKGMMCNRDISSPDTEIMEMSIAENEAALKFADELGAAGYVLHVTNNQEGDSTKRRKIMEASFAPLERFFEFYLRNIKTRTQIFIENLEYPKFPARSDEFEWYFQEACNLFRRVESRLGPDYKRDFYVLGMVLDIPHFAFNEMLRGGFNENTLANIPNWVHGFVDHNFNYIRYYHLAGCKLHKKGNLWLSTHDYINEIEREYSPDELNIRQILANPHIKLRDMMLEVANVPYYYLSNTRANVLNFLQKPFMMAAMKYATPRPKPVYLYKDVQLLQSDTTVDITREVDDRIKTRLGTIALPIWKDRLSRAGAINSQFEMENIEITAGRRDYDSELEKNIQKC